MACLRMETERQRPPNLHLLTGSFLHLLAHLVFPFMPGLPGKGRGPGRCSVGKGLAMKV